ncbi:hypothetical protein BD770DRAFT_458312 [Pilaira anomala]|nr:hypothetical protein BD770DRAFT_458312 [Pilaira anomala]
MLSPCKGESHKEEAQNHKELQIITVKSSVKGIGWKDEYVDTLKKLIYDVNIIVTHTFSLIKYIFIHELNTNENFELEEFATRGFYREVFLSLLDYKRRDGSTGGKSKLSETVNKFRRIIEKHFESYKECSSYVPIKLSNAQQIATYESIKIETAFDNNLILQFGNQLRRFINTVLQKKERISQLKTDLTNKHCSDAEIKASIKTNVIEPITQVKLAISTKDINKMPKGFIGDKKVLGYINDLFSSYDSSYKFKKGSIYYDVKASPRKHLLAYFKLANLCESCKIKSFQCFPTRKKFIPCHITIDTKILNNHILKNTNQGKLDKQRLWDQVINMSTKAVKPQGKAKSIQFRGTIMTDGIAVSVIKQNEDTSKGNCSKSTLSKTVDENIDYLEKLSLQEHVSTVGKCVLIDPGRRDLLYCMSENSEKDKKLVYRYTRNQKAVETKSTKFRKLRQKYKPEHVKEAEEKLSLHAASTVDINKYKNYIRARAEVSQDLYQYYSNEDKKKEERPENTLPFRKLKLSSYINQVQADKRLASNLRRKFGKDSVLVFGDWSGAHTKFHEPIRGKGTRRMLKKEGFQVYLLNEYKTSSVCPTCTSSSLETFKKCKNPRPYQRSKNPIVNCHGLLR